MATTSVLLVPVPEADAVVGDVRRAHDPSAAAGLGAHVTIATPFARVEEWDRVVGRLRRACAGVRPFDARFRETGRFGSTTLFLIPEPFESFRGLCAAIAAAFPEWPPYGGAFSEVHPHLTLVHGAEPLALDQVEAAIRGRVDVRARVSRLALFSKSDDAPWREQRSLVLGEG